VAEDGYEEGDGEGYCPGEEHEEVVPEEAAVRSVAGEETGGEEEEGENCECPYYSLECDVRFELTPQSIGLRD
jgi:hypothetical protein